MQFKSIFQLASIFLLLFIVPVSQVCAACREGDNSTSKGSVGRIGEEVGPGGVGSEAISIPIPPLTVSPRADFGSTRTPFYEITRHVNFTVNCDNPYYLVHTLSQDLGESGEIVSGIQTVFNTSLSGVGVYFPSLNTTGRMDISGPYTAPLSFSGPLIRAALIPLASGSTSYGVLYTSVGLPHYTVSVTESSSGSGSGDYFIGTYRFDGVITYIAPTCNAEDKDVFLGNHNVGVFTGTSTTSWVDASIVMNCDQSFSNAFNEIISYDETSSNVSTTIRPDNYYSVSLNPIYGFIDNDRGIIELSNDSSVSASGVGIQLSRTQAEMNWGGIYQWIDLNTPASNTINIPLFARYIQTGATVTPGSANSKIVYTVTYK